MRSGLVVRLGAEAAGTLLLVYLGCGALLAGASGLLGASIGFALALASAILIFGVPSGGHFNPWVTLAVVLRGRIGVADAAGYVGAQLVGGFAGALLVWVTYGDNGVAGRLGATRLAPAASSGSGLIGALIAEAVATFVLVCVVLAVTTPVPTANASTANRLPGPGGAVGRALVIGLTVALGMLSIGVITGGSMNFARTLASELALALAGGDAAWGDIWVYLVGPAIGAIGAAFAYEPMSRSIP